MGLLPPLTRKQLFYIIVMKCIGAGLVDAAINFGIACAMYRGARKVSVWRLSENTLAGDAGVTVVIQVMLTWIIDGLLTRNDVRKGAQEPIRGWGPPSTGPLGLWLYHGDFDFISKGPRPRIIRFILNGIRGFIYTTLVWCIFWPLSLAYLVPVFGSTHHVRGWGPEGFKAVYAGVMGAVTTPPVTILAMSEAGRKEQLRDEGRVADVNGASTGRSEKSKVPEVPV